MVKSKFSQKKILWPLKNQLKGWLSQSHNIYSLMVSHCYGSSYNTNLLPASIVFISPLHLHVCSFVSLVQWKVKSFPLDNTVSQSICNMTRNWSQATICSVFSFLSTSPQAPVRLQNNLEYIQGSVWFFKNGCLLKFQKEVLLIRLQPD